jgi:hypothetical protein
MKDYGENLEKKQYITFITIQKKYITIHPIKFSNFSLQNIVDKYVYFMNAVCF